MEFSDTAVREIGRKRTAIAIPRETIRKISLVYDTRARNPFLQFFLGFVLVTLGAIGLTVSFMTSLRGGLPITVVSGVVMFQPVPAALWLMLALGGWSLTGVFRAGYLLQIETDSGARKIFFQKSTSLQDIRQFIRKVNWTFGYEIDTSVLEKMQAPSLTGQGQ